MSGKESIQRSVDSLERICSVVVGLAITVAIQGVLMDEHGRIHRWESDGTGQDLPSVLARSLPTLLAFLVTIVPFYHGMNRHLDATYVEKQATRRNHALLLVDFGVFFVEACVLLALAALVQLGVQAFAALVLLLALDAAWGFFISLVHDQSSAWTWAWINVVAVVVVSLVLWLDPFGHELAACWGLFVLAAARTVADYGLCWHFYFPQDHVAPSESGGTGPA